MSFTPHKRLPGFGQGIPRFHRLKGGTRKTTPLPPASAPPTPTILKKKKKMKIKNKRRGNKSTSPSTSRKRQTIIDWNGSLIKDKQKTRRTGPTLRKCPPTYPLDVQPYTVPSTESQSRRFPVRTRAPPTQHTTEGEATRCTHWQQAGPTSTERGRANTITTPNQFNTHPFLSLTLSLSLPLSKSAAAFGGDTLVSNSGTRTIKTEGGRGVRTGWGRVGGGVGG